MMRYGYIELPKISGKGEAKHRIRLDLCSRFPVEDILDEDFVHKVISFIDKRNLILDYDRIDIILSKNDRRLMATKKVIGKIGRFKIRRNSIERYNVYVVEK